MKLIHTASSALESHFQRLHSGRRRRRNRSSTPSPRGNKPQKAA